MSHRHRFQKSQSLRIPNLASFARSSAGFTDLFVNIACGLISLRCLSVGCCVACCQRVGSEVEVDVHGSHHLDSQVLCHFRKPPPVK